MQSVSPAEGGEVVQGDLLPSDVNSLNDTLTGIRVDLAEIKTLLASVTTRSEDHEARIRKLERALWMVAGAASAGGGTAGALITQVLGG